MGDDRGTEDPKRSAAKPKALFAELMRVVSNIIPVVIPNAY